MPDEPGSRYPGRLLRTTSDYAWRLLVIGITGYLALRVLGHLLEVIVPLAVALLISALLEPLHAALRRRGGHNGLATVATILIAIVVFAGIIALVVERAIDELPQLADQINAVIPHLRHWLETGPFHIQRRTIDNLSETISREVSRHTSTLVSAATSTGRTVLDFLIGTLLTFFITIFFLYDGPKVWHFVTLAAPRGAREQLDVGGRAAWGTLRHYVHGTLIVAVFHGLAIAVVLSILGVPLVLPLAVLVAVGSLVPIVGAVVTGLVAVGVAGVTQGLTAAIVVAIVLIVDNQIESHLLQPFVVGRYVRIHPLATVLALSAGALLAGILGAIFAVPVTASVSAAVRAILHHDNPPSAETPSPPVADGPADGSAAESAQTQAPRVARDRGWLRLPWRRRQ